MGNEDKSGVPVIPTPDQEPLPSTRTITVGPETTVTFPSIIPEISTIDAERQITQIFSSMEAQRFKPRSVPNRLKDTNNPLADPEYLKESLIFPKQYRAGRLTDDTKHRVHQQTYETLEAHAPLNIHIGPIGSFKAPDLIAGSPDNQADYGEYLFLQQVGDFLKTIKAYPFGIQASIILDDIGDHFIWQNSGLSLEETTHKSYADSLSRLASHALPLDDKRVKLSLLRTSELGTSLYQSSLNSNLEELSSAWESLSPVFTQFLKDYDFNYWDSYYLALKNPLNDTATYDDHTSPLINRIHEIYPNLAAAGINELTPYSLFLLTSHIEDLVQSTPLIANNKRVPIPHSQWKTYPLIMRAAMRMLAREMALNNIYLSGQEKHIFNSAASTRIIPGDVNVFSRQLIDRFGNSVNLSGQKYGNIPNLNHPYLYLLKVPMVLGNPPGDPGRVEFTPQIGRYLAGQKDLPILTISKKGQQFHLPITVSKPL